MRSHHFFKEYLLENTFEHLGIQGAEDDEPLGNTCPSFLQESVSPEPAMPRQASTSRRGSKTVRRRVSKSNASRRVSRTISVTSQGSEPNMAQAGWPRGSLLPEGAKGNLLVPADIDCTSKETPPGRGFLRRKARLEKAAVLAGGSAPA